MVVIYLSTTIYREKIRLKIFHQFVRKLTENIWPRRVHGYKPRITDPTSEWGHRSLLCRQEDVRHQHALPRPGEECRLRQTSKHEGWTLWMFLNLQAGDRQSLLIVSVRADLPRKISIWFLKIIGSDWADRDSAWKSFIYQITGGVYQCCK